MDGKRADAQEKHESILDLHGLVAGDSVAVGYLNDGKNEGESADRWRLVTVSFILLTVVWLLFSYGLGYFVAEEAHSIWTNLVRTASLTGVLLFGAAYSSRQSSAHRERERKARWFGLEVKALDPYIASIPSEQQHLLKIKIAEKIFGQSSSEVNQEAGPHLDNEMLKTLLDHLTKVLPKAS